MKLKRFTLYASAPVVSVVLLSSSIGLAESPTHPAAIAAVIMGVAPMTESATQPGSIVALDIDIVLDEVSPEEQGISVGQHHECRIYYDRTKVDPKTHYVRVLHQQHTPMLIPKHLNELQEPMSNAWLDMSGSTYRYHMAASPTGGGFPFPYTILFDENTMRMTIRKQSDGSLLLAGSYTISTKPITGPSVDAVVATSDPLKMPWEKDPPMGIGSPANDSASSAGRLSTNSTYGSLLANPGAKAILAELIPEVVNNPQSQMGEGMPLKALSQFEPTLTPEKLKEIDARLGNLHPTQ